MDQSSSLLRSIPSIGLLLELPAAQRLAEDYSPALTADALRMAAEALRGQILAGQAREIDADHREDE